VVKEKPENPLEAIESISVKVKSGTNDPTVYKEVPPIAPQSEEAKKLAEKIEKTLVLNEPVYDNEEPLPSVPIQDVVSDLSLLEWAGVAFSQEDAYKLSQSIQRLADELALEEVKFFGKIFGTQKDYYIVEARANPNTEITDDSPELEPWGRGVNEYTYYVSNSVLGPWTALPLLRPEWIVIARNTRRFLTGNLDAPVLGFPRFPANEAAYLRVQIARIAAATWVAPQGYYMQEETNNGYELRPDEGFQGIDALDLLSPNNWQHARRGILTQGRVDPYIPERLDDEEPQDQQEEEMPLPLLAPLSEDNHGFEPLNRETEATGSWTFNVAPHERSNNAVACAYSLAWPGAVTVYKDRRVVSIYVGYGVKYINGPYSPPPPPPIQQEYAAPVDADTGVDPMEEQPDPQPEKDDDEDDENDEEVLDEDEEPLDEDM